MTMEKQKLENWIPQFLHHLQVERRSSANTIAAYGRDLNHYVSFLKDRYSTDELFATEHFTKAIVRGFLSELLKEKYSARSTGRKLSALRMFARYLVRKGVLEANPVANIASPKLDKKLPSFMTKSEVKALLSLPDVETFEGLRDYLILELFYATGIRVSELINIKTSDVNLNSGTLTVLGKGNKKRVLPLPGIVIEDIRRYLQQIEVQDSVKQEYNRYLFVKEKKEPFTRQQVATIVQNYIKKVADTEKAHPHSLRHTFATHLLDSGADLMSVKELLGHSNLGTTEIYTHVSAEHLKRIYKQAHPRANEK